MDAKDFVIGTFVIDNSSKRHVLEHVVNPLENTVGIVDIFVQATSTLLTQTQISVHVSVFMVATQHKNLLWIFQFQGHQQTNYFQTLGAFINVVT
jgi:CMP-N-acetylneuraminic acid synthetase